METKYYSVIVILDNNSFRQSFNSLNAAILFCRNIAINGTGKTSFTIKEVTGSNYTDVFAASYNGARFSYTCDVYGLKTKKIAPSSKHTYDVMLDKDANTIVKGFSLTMDEAIDYITGNCFSDFSGGVVAALCKETGELAYLELIPE